MKVIAVVVTYNRLELLKLTIAHLKATAGLHAIVVINNGSTDATSDWLAEQEGIDVVTQENVGGSGGFYTGMKRAYDMGADWLWCMDDDVYPEDSCLEQLMALADDTSIGILCPRRMRAGKVFVNECGKINMSNPLLSMHQQRLTPDVSAPTNIEGMVFEGPLIRRQVVEKIGFPNKDLFIFYDDTDYSLRTVMAGFRVVYVPDAIIQKKLFFTDDSWTEKQRKKKQKRLYQVRNSAYFNHRYGCNAMVRYARAFIGMQGFLWSAILLTITRQGYRWRDVADIARAYRDGINEQLGKIS